MIHVDTNEERCSVRKRCEQDLYNMKVRMCLRLCCLLLTSWILSLSAAECQDSTKGCRVDGCNRPGYSSYCKKTCGRCGHEPTVSPRRWREQCAERYRGRCRQCVPDSGNCGACKSCFEGSSCTDVSSECKCNPDNICECNPGYHGRWCDQECPENCLNKTCESPGTCTHGCKTGWHGVRCDNNCSEHCVNDTCISGRCSLGCDTGWFGRSCDQPCPGHCRSGSCDRLDGSCTSCLDGYMGSHCNVTCPQYCAGHKCDQTDGACQGCEVGWFGRRCNSSCPKNCAGETCDQTDGACPVCEVGWFGRHCNNSCPENCEAETCGQIDGACSSCKVGWFGRHCNSSCPENCPEKTCDQTDGACTLGCEAGWFGDDCGSPCPAECESCTREDGRCSSAGVRGIVTWVVLPVLVITLLLIVCVLLVARSIKTERFKLCHKFVGNQGGTYTNPRSGFFQGSPEGSPPVYDELQLVSERHYNPWDFSSPPPLPPRPHNLGN